MSSSKVEREQEKFAPDRVQFAQNKNLKDSVAALCKYEAEQGGELYIGFEPKPNEGHPAMLIPTVASAIAFWEEA